MRSIWKGHIQFSLVTIPVKVYNAIDTAQAIHFNQLHKGCNGPIAYDKRCKKCNKVLSNEEIVKGYQYEPDQYVILEPEDLEKIRLKSTKVIEIQGFVDASEVHPMLYEAPYFAGPDGVVAEEARPAVDIMTALKQSIEQAMAQRQPMVKATGKGKKAKAEQPEEQGGAAEVKASEVKSPKGGRRKLG